MISHLKISFKLPGALTGSSRRGVHVTPLHAAPPMREGSSSRSDKPKSSSSRPSKRSGGSGNTSSRKPGNIAQRPSSVSDDQVTRLEDMNQDLFVRVYDIKVPYAEDPGKDNLEVTQLLLDKVVKKLKLKGALGVDSVFLVRKSFDARRGKLAFAYVVDVEAAALQRAGMKKIIEENGKFEIVDRSDFAPARVASGQSSGSSASAGNKKRDPVVVVGSGPAGIFAALAAVEQGLPVILCERGQPVEVRGADIGRLMVRRELNAESNLCYGEGGAGTWSDGKLTTRIGRNSEEVRHVLQTLYRFGAPEATLISGKPHLGTDRLVKILRSFREYLISRGAEVRFGCKVEDLVVKDRVATGVRLVDGEEIRASAVVLAVGHSARALYRNLQAHGVNLSAKPFAMGFRIEHPQSLINSVQYGEEPAALVLQGKGPLPVADYKLTAEVDPRAQVLQQVAANDTEWTDRVRPLDTNLRSVFSFCMCPGGQIVPTSCVEDELCINGMSFSRRNSKWANSALVVGIVPRDWAAYEAEHGVLAGVALQEAIERKAAAMGGMGLRAPVQRASDFLEGRPSQEPLPSSSYRLGVTNARCDQLYSEEITAALRQALLRFDRSLPGFATHPDALLHGVETRTSAPVRIERLDEDAGARALQSTSIEGLYPTGEGAGYAGGIVSAAVDGWRVGAMLAAALTGAPLPVGGGGKKRPTANSLTY